MILIPSTAPAPANNCDISFLSTVNFPESLIKLSFSENKLFVVVYAFMLDKK